MNNIPNKISIRVENREEYCELMRILDENGYEWTSGAKILDSSRDYSWFAKGGLYYVCLWDGKVSKSGSPYLTNYQAEAFIETFGSEIEPLDLSMLFA